MIWHDYELIELNPRSPGCQTLPFLLHDSSRGRKGERVVLARGKDRPPPIYHESQEVWTRVPVVEPGKANGVLDHRANFIRMAACALTRFLQNWTELTHACGAHSCAPYGAIPAPGIPMRPRSLGRTEVRPLRGFRWRWRI